MPCLYGLLTPVFHEIKNDYCIGRHFVPGGFFLLQEKGIQCKRTVGSAG
jgi:hypothetical protein